jgi:hypothetical protein
MNVSEAHCIAYPAGCKTELQDSDRIGGRKADEKLERSFPDRQITGGDQSGFASSGWDEIKVDQSDFPSLLYHLPSRTDVMFDAVDRNSFCRSMQLANGSVP